MGTSWDENPLERSKRGAIVWLARLGAAHGSLGGSSPKATIEEAHEIWRLHKQGLGPYPIAETVFGDRRFHRRVRTVIGH